MWTETALDSMTVVGIKNILKSLGLSQVGVKKDLITRILEHQKNKAKAPAAPPVQNPVAKNETPAVDASASSEEQRKRRKRKRPQRIVLASNPVTSSSQTAVEIEYVSAALEVDETDPNQADFLRVFTSFTSAEELTKLPTPEDKTVKVEVSADEAPAKPDSDEEEAAEEPKISNKQRKKLKRLSIAELKQLVKRPDIVEVWDPNSMDPRLLIHLKAYRNTVAVPAHWCLKRKYLQGKRGIEKPPFKLPDFIEDTGIAKMRQTGDDKTMKAKARERMQPKMHKMDIDYQVLHDAFFRYQTKPKMSSIGDLYYEGKEFEVVLRAAKPGHLSATLKEALGMPEGAPPPWLVNQQRYGPPPSYPNLKIAGLNAPIPAGASFGYHPGGWGKVPVNELGQPLYGNVWGTPQEEKIRLDKESQFAAPVERARWGELNQEEEEAWEEEEEPEAAKKSDDEGSIASGIESTISGLDTPEAVHLRKETRPSGTDTEERPLFTVLEAQPAQVQSGQLMGSAYTYKMPGQAAPAAAAPNSAAIVAAALAAVAAGQKQAALQAASAASLPDTTGGTVTPMSVVTDVSGFTGTTAASAATKPKPTIAEMAARVNLIKSQKSSALDISLDPSELEDFDEKALHDRYEAVQAAQKAANEPAHEDMTDLLEEQQRKQQRRAQKAKEAKSSKKEKNVF